MPRLSVRSIWLQSIICLGIIVGVIAGDISVAQARVATNHKRAALRKLHRAEAAYVAQVDAISRQLFVAVQPVQNSLDKLDATRPQYIDAARDSVVNSRTTTTVARLGARLAKLQPTTTLTVQHQALRNALRDMSKHLTTLEHGKKSKDASDMLDEPYSGAALNLSIAEDDWQKTLVALDTATHRTQAPSPGGIGSHRPRAALPASKASWIFSADASCATAAHALYALKDPGDSASLGALAKYEDRYAAIVAKVTGDLRRVAMPAADRAYLQRTIYRSLKANDTLATSARNVARGLRTRDISLLNQAESQDHVAAKGLSTLSHDMTAYGAEYCGWYFDPHPKNDTKKGNGAVSA